MADFDVIVVGGGLCGAAVLRDCVLRGLTALLAMMNSCAPGVTVVNIDNGFGAGYAAAMINNTSVETARTGGAVETTTHE